MYSTICHLRNIAIVFIFFSKNQLNQMELKLMEKRAQEKLQQELLLQQVGLSFSLTWCPKTMAMSERGLVIFFLSLRGSYYLFI